MPTTSSFMTCSNSQHTDTPTLSIVSSSPCLISFTCADLTMFTSDLTCASHATTSPSTLNSTSYIIHTARTASSTPLTTTLLHAAGRKRSRRHIPDKTVSTRKTCKDNSSEGASHSSSISEHLVYSTSSPATVTVILLQDCHQLPQTSYWSPALLLRQRITALHWAVIATQCRPRPLYQVVVVLPC